MFGRVILTGFAAPDEASLGDFEDPQIPPRSRPDLYPDFLFRFRPEVTPSEVGAMAARAALSLCEIDSTSVDMVIACSHTPDMESPGLAPLVLRKLGMAGPPGLELRALSAGPLIAIEHAAHLIQCRRASRILVVTVDLLTRFFPGEFLRGTMSLARGVCGDGAAAFLVVSEEAFRSIPTDQLSLDLLSIDIKGVGVAPDVFATEAPSSSRAPVRISRDDIEAHRDVPALHVHRLFAHALHYLPPSIDEARGRDAAEQSIFQLHEIVAGLAGGVLTACDNSFTGFHDVFTSRGFVGSAGLPLGFSVLPPEALDNGTTLTACGIGSGPVWGVATLRRRT